jgi:hypothetical protein
MREWHIRAPKYSWHLAGAHPFVPEYVDLCATSLDRCIRVVYWLFRALLT